jgi:carbonic anhydrase
MDKSRRTFLLEAGTGLALATAPQAVAAAAGMSDGAKSALKTLLEGNARFVADKAACPPLTTRRIELAQGQKPFAIIVSCSDSRVPVEIIFDQAPGNIFGIRIAGNFVDEHGLGSIEYSVASFASSLILVLGHTECGAVKATVGYLKDGTAQPSHIQTLIAAIAPAAKEAKSMLGDAAGDWVSNATIQNVHENIANLTARSPIVAGAVKDGKLSIAGGIYDLHSGKVTIVK